MNGREKKKLADYIIDDIKKMVESGFLKEGDKLPNQTEFAKQLGVSRLSLREALQKLQIMGLIEQKPKLGTIIKCGDIEKWNDNIVFTITDDKDNVYQLIEARMVLEEAATKRMCIKGTKDDIKKLNKILNASEEAFKNRDMEKYIEYDAKFHLYIIDKMENKYVKNMYMAIFNSVLKYMEELFYSFPSVWAESPNRHRAIFEALKNKDIEGVEREIKISQEADWGFFKEFYHGK